MLNTSPRHGLRCLLAALVLLLGACSKDVEGPKPEVAPPSKDADPAPVDPGIVCNAQSESTVTLHGENFSPVPIDIPKDPKIALPTITLSRAHELDGRDVTAPDAVVWSGDPDKDPTNAYTEDEKTPLVTWKSREEMSFTVTQSLMLPEGKRGLLPQGVYDVEVKNANGSKVTSVGSLAVVNKPELTETTPSIVCLDEADQDVVLTGTTFLRLEGTTPTLTVEGAAPERELALDGCEAIKHEGITAERCPTATVKLAKGSVDAGYPLLTLNNPETAACHTEEEIRLRVVKKPTIDRVGPPLGCVSEEDRKFVVEGTGFLTIDGTLPTATIANVDVEVSVDAADCEELETMGHEVQICTALTVTVGKDEIDPGLHPLFVKNPDPAGCSATAEGAVRIVPPPSIDNVVPPLVCLDDGAREITVEGDDFLIVDDVVPLVTVDGMKLAASAIAPTGCDDLDTPELDVQRCDTLVVTLAQGSVGLGMPDINVENPQPAGCEDERSDLLTVVAGPTITSAAPALVCSEDMARAITITGTGFVRLHGGTNPAVSIGGTAATVDSLAGCSTVMVNGLPTEQCTTIDVTVAQGALDSGNPEVVVVNPTPAGCSATRADVLAVPPLLAFAPEPINVCQNATGVIPVSLVGDGFLRVDGVDPTVMWNGGAITPTDIPAADCTTIELPAGSGITSASSCKTIDLSVDITGLTGTVGTMLPIVVSNAHVASCPLTQTANINVVAPPTVTDAEVVGNDPTFLQNTCSDQAFSLLITGSGFVSGSVVKLVSTKETITADSVTFTDSTSLTATFSNGLTFDAADPTYDVVVDAGGCVAPALADWIIVDPTPLVFFVDPPLVYNGITIDATVFTSGVAVAGLKTIEMIGPQGGTVTTTELVDVSPSPNPKPNRILARIPGIDTGTSQPTFSPGDYTVRVTTNHDCVGALDGGVKVTDTLDDALLTAITPSFVSPTKPTGVTITGAGFLAVPRLYLTPSSGTGNAVALRAAELSSATQLTAVIPGDATTPLSAGNYDLVAVNPDGKVDVLAASVTITSGEPPVVESVVPASLASNENLTTDVKLHGVDFDVASVELECKASPTAATSVIVPGVIQGTPTATDATVQFNIGASGSPAGSICLVRLVNTDGAFFDYSALSLTNSSYNLSSWQLTSTQLTTGRRALSLLAGRPTTSSRFLYAIGGDAGGAGNTQTIGSVYDTVEAASIDVFGAMGTWTDQRNDLSQTVVNDVPSATPRTAAGAARVGRFMYLVGGYESGTATATDTLLRAQILDPLATPEVDDLDAQLGDATAGPAGLGEGLYYYRVAAIFPSNDPSNPGGESLAGELLPVQLPAGPDGPGGDGIVLTLTWTPVPGAHGYRIYRTASANAALSELALLKEQTCGTLPTDVCDCAAPASTDCVLTDDGTLTVTAADKPMPAGSLGVWHAMDGARCTDPRVTPSCMLTTERESAAVTAVQDRTDPTKYYLYAFGGRDAGATYLDTYEMATITVAGDGSQTVGAWTVGGDTLASPRAELGVWVMSAENSSIIRSSGTPNDVWIFVGGGRTTGGGVVSSREAALLQAGGALSTFTATDALQGTGLAGFGAGAANDFLYTFGGKSGTADGTSAKLSDGTGGGNPLPDLRNPTAEGNATTQRQYHGTTQESAFFFVAGGHDGTNVLSTIQRTVQ